LYEWKADKQWDAWCPKNSELLFTCPVSRRENNIEFYPGMTSVAVIFSTLCFIGIACLARKFHWAIPKSTHDNLSLFNGFDMAERGSEEIMSSESENILKQSKGGYSSLECSPE
jgi:hypothetical protein